MAPWNHPNIKLWYNLSIYYSSQFTSNQLLVCVGEMYIWVTSVSFSIHESWRSCFALSTLSVGSRPKGHFFYLFVCFSCVNEALLGCYTERLSSKGDLHFICSGMCPRGSHIHNETLRNPISTQLSVFLWLVLFSTICLSHGKRREGGRQAGLKGNVFYYYTYINRWIHNKGKQIIEVWWQPIKSQIFHRYAMTWLVIIGQPYSTDFFYFKN